MFAQTKGKSSNHVLIQFQLYGFKIRLSVGECRSTPPEKRKKNPKKSQPRGIRDT